MFCHFRNCFSRTSFFSLFVCHFNLFVKSEIIVLTIFHVPFVFALYSARKNIVTEANSLSHQAMRIKIENDLRNKHQENTVDIKRELTKLRHRNEDLEGKKKRINVLTFWIRTSYLICFHLNLLFCILLPIKINHFFFYTNKHFNLTFLFSRNISTNTFVNLLLFPPFSCSFVIRPMS